MRASSKAEYNRLAEFSRVQRTAGSTSRTAAFDAASGRRLWAAREGGPIA